MITRYIQGLAVLMLISSCNGNTSSNAPTDTPLKGEIHISVDESFKPVIDRQIDMYQASWPDTKIIAHYKSEADCVNDYFNDSATSLIIIARELNAKEQGVLTAQQRLLPETGYLARDAVTVVLNNAYPDTAISLSYLKNLLIGKGEKGKVAVFDGFNATSTVRFAIDSITRGQNLDTNSVRAVKNSKEVLEYVAANPNSIGFVGFSWIGNPEMPEQVEMLKKVKLAALPCLNCDSAQWIKPTPYSMAARQYPLVRSLYYLLKDRYQGLGSGFCSFMRYERGQLIFRRAYLAPSMDLTVRDVILDSVVKKR